MTTKTGKSYKCKRLKQNDTPYIRYITLEYDWN